MKKIFILVIIICATICTNKMTANALQTTTISETEEPTSNTSLSDEDLEGFTFYTNAKLYYKDGGHWKYYGTFPVYFNRADTKDGCNQWVRFSTYTFMPASYHDNDNLEWPRRVKYQGIYFYF